jgi:hypothetical protein
VEIKMTTLTSQQHDEITALRGLEAAVRACGLPGMMVSGKKPLERLAEALQRIESARGGAANGGR